MEVSSDSEGATAGPSDLKQKKREREKLSEPDANSLKKARFAWQVKGVKKDVLDKGLETNLAESHRFHVESSSGDDTDQNCSSSEVDISGSNRLHCTNELSHLRESLCQNDVEFLGVFSEATGHVSPGNEVEDSDEENMAVCDHENRVRNITNNYWERRAPFDIFRSAVNIATCPNCHWQKQELGCAIVDNVFNRTLEEIGISPDPKVNKSARFIERALENQGIESAIRLQGLRSSMAARHGPQSTSTLSPEYSNLDLVQRTSMSVDDHEAISLATPDVMSEEVDNIDSDCSDDNKDAMSESKLLETESLNDTVICSSQSHSAIINDDKHLQVMDCRSESVVNCTAQPVPENNINKSSTSPVCMSSNTVTETDQACGDRVPVDTDPAYMLDLAVSTAIRSQGLAVEMN